MALTPRIELRQSQTLVMTPQLQQAITLLKMTSSALAEYVAAEVEKNPLLDLAPTLISEDGPILRASGVAAAASGEDDIFQRIAARPTLWDHLRDQIGAMRIGTETAEVALILVDELEDDGYLRVPLDEVASRHRLSHSDLRRALRVLQSCDPSGIGARNLEECLALQLRERDRFDPAMQALLANLRLSVRGPSRELQELCGVDAEDLVEMLAELRALDPRPGLQFANEQIQITVPDVYVVRSDAGGLKVELNTEALPRVLMDNIYSVELASHDAKAKAFVSECRATGTWLIKALEQRARTILKVATEIVLQQERFFSDGVLAMQPLTQRMVADRIKVHESTVSRVTAGKYLACDQGVFELRHFFGSSIQATDGGEEFSAAAVQSRIRSLIDAESPERTVSDDRIVKALRLQGIDIARRTVAKYREGMGIPSSVERRRYKARLAGL